MPRWLLCSCLWLVMPLSVVAQDVATAARSHASPADREENAAARAATRARAASGARTNAGFDAERVSAAAPSPPVAVQATPRELSPELSLPELSLPVFAPSPLVLAQATPPVLSPPPERIPVPPRYAPGPGPSLSVPGDTLVALQDTAPPGSEASTGSVYVIAASHVIPFPASLKGRDLARREQLQNELDVVETQLDDIEPERVNTTGPVAAMVLGYGSGFASAFVALAAFRRAEAVQHGTTAADDDRERRDRRFARGFGVGAVLGLALGVGGSIGLSRRRAERQDKLQAREELLAKRDQLRRQLGLALDMSPRDVQVGVQGRF